MQLQATEVLSRSKGHKMTYKLINLLNGKIIEESEDLSKLFNSLRMYSVIVKGSNQSIVAGRPHHLLDTMNRENAHTLPLFMQVWGN